MQTQQHSHQHDSGVCQRHARRHSVHGPRNRHTDPISILSRGGPQLAFWLSYRALGTKPRKRGSLCSRRWDLKRDDGFNASDRACPEGRWSGPSDCPRQDSFRVDGQWADSRPSPTERWREVCRSVVAIGARMVKGHVPRQQESAMSGGGAGVGWSLDLMRAADRRETSPKDRRSWSTRAVELVAVSFHDVRDGITKSSNFRGASL